MSCFGSSWSCWSREHVLVSLALLVLPAFVCPSGVVGLWGYMVLQSTWSMHLLVFGVGWSLFLVRLCRCLVRCVVLLCCRLGWPRNAVVSSVFGWVRPFCFEMHLFVHNLVPFEAKRRIWNLKGVKTGQTKNWAALPAYNLRHFETSTRNCQIGRAHV